MSTTTRIAAIAGQEIRIARRNRWVALATGLFTLFALALTFLGAGQGVAVKADILTLSAASLATLSVYLIPLIALILSYDTLAGEAERGTLPLTLATPVKRWELFVGKFLSQTAVVSAAILIGYSIAGGTAAALMGWEAEGLVAWARLIATSVALGAVFVALGLAVSASTARSGTAAAIAIGLWLVFVVLYDLALLGAVIADNGGAFTKSVFPWLVLANPADAFRIYNLVMLDTAPVAGIDGLAQTLPVPPATALAITAGWLATALAVGIALTRRIRP
jgi:Cu-processing system permease protein